MNLLLMTNFHVLITGKHQKGIHTIYFKQLVLVPWLAFQAKYFKVETTVILPGYLGLFDSIKELTTHLLLCLRRDSNSRPLPIKEYNFSRKKKIGLGATEMELKVSMSV